MSEITKEFNSLEEVERTLETTKEFLDNEQVYIFIGALRFIYKENQQLKSQLQQRDEVIDKIRNKIEWLKENVFMEERNLTSDFEEILEILDE